MKKVPTIFVRDWGGDRSRVTDTVNPVCGWVFMGEGVATRKWDGTSCLVRGGRLFKRYELKPGKTAPNGFEAASETDTETGKQPGWVPVGDGPEDALHREGFTNYCCGAVPDDGTYELVGPKVQGNPDGFDRVSLLRHGLAVLPGVPRDFDGLKTYLAENAVEGIVFHHPDGRMGKIKARDFGIPWPRQEGDGA